MKSGGLNVTDVLPDIPHPDDKGKNLSVKRKKQKQELANKLKQSFGLSEDALPWSRKENCYKARFIIRADDNVLRQLTVDNDRHRLLRTRQLPSS